MSQSKDQRCPTCGHALQVERRNYRYTESGLSNVVLQGVEVAECGGCGDFEVTIPRMAMIHRAIPRALTNSPGRLTGEQLRFLRKHLEMSGDQLAKYLHTDKSKISKWERGEDPIGPTTDRLVRLVVVVLDGELREGATAVAEHLPLISDSSGINWELHIDTATLQPTFLSVSKAA